MSSQPDEFKKQVQASLRRQATAIKHHVARGTYFFDYGNAFLLEASRAGADVMSVLPDSITALIAALNKLPGVGPRSAERIALHLVQSDNAAVRQLADAMLLAREKIQFCTTCGALTEKSPCPIF